MQIDVASSVVVASFMRFLVAPPPPRRPSFGQNSADWYEHCARAVMQNNDMKVASCRVRYAPIAARQQRCAHFLRKPRTRKRDREPRPAANASALGSDAAA